MRLGDFSAHVVVEEQELKEYEVTVNSSGTQATCWISSEAGKVSMHAFTQAFPKKCSMGLSLVQKFSVKWRRHSINGLASQGSLAVDGIGCSVNTLLSTDNKDTASCSKMVRDTTKRDLMFCDLQLSDDEALLGKSVPSHLGEITLCIVCGTSRRKRRRVQGMSLQLTSHANTYHEKSVKKLTTHCVGFGLERERSLHSTYWEVTPNQDPPLEFVFKYRPIGILQANDIAPRPAPAISTALSDNPSDALKTQSGVFERIALLESELKRLRSEVYNEVDDQKPKRMKRERVENRPVVHGAVIDLT